MIDVDWTLPPTCMPDEYKDDDPVLAYRQYYIGEKSALLSWNNRDVPEFVTKKLE